MKLEVLPQSFSVCKVADYAGVDLGAPFVFTGATDGEKSLERIEKLVKQLGEKGIKQKLDDMGVPYPPKMAVSQLALLLLQQQGEV